MRLVRRAEGGDRQCQVELLEALSAEQSPEDQINGHVVINDCNGESQTTWSGKPQRQGGKQKKQTRCSLPLTTVATIQGFLNQGKTNKNNKTRLDQPVSQKHQNQSINRKSLIR